ncbi:hypothetical protein HKK58_12160 [Pseudomonas sp. ADAK22]|uniref:hypothetical protein n=1 Tax=Pseudomonas sp. ADAK22 TaxID=2730851 RepID=UPI001464081A|nr:hypothetical protein [Pseudomonas sp. ADAK22]QJI13248.1 hypothetical protein HKK58_12160 [Pseudomonas sp. ADAK22]
MDITIHRKKGLFDSAYGQAIALAILFDGKVVGRMETGETLFLVFPDTCGTLQVGLLDPANSPYMGRMSGALISISNAQSLTPGQAVQAFSVRTRKWVFFDVLGLAGIAPFKRWALGAGA